MFGLLSKLFRKQKKSTAIPLSNDINFISTIGTIIKK